MIVRVLSGSLLFFLLTFPTDGPFATQLDGNNDDPSAGTPANTSVMDESYAVSSVTFVSSFNQTEIALGNDGISGIGEEERTEPSVRDHSEKRIENQNSTENNKKKNSGRGSDMEYGSTREFDTSTTSWITSSILRQKDLDTGHDESVSTADQVLTDKPRELHTAFATLHSPSAPFENYTTPSIVSTGSHREIVHENESTHSSRNSAGIPEVVRITSGPAAGKLLKRTEHGHKVLLSTAAQSVDPLTPDFKTEMKLDQSSGTSAEDDLMTQANDVQNRKRDVNVTQQEVTKAELAYKSLWDEGDTEEDDGKMETEGVGRGGTNVKGNGERGGTWKIMDEKREEESRFTIPVELWKARNRNEHFNLSFHGLPWRDELSILIPVLCGMFGAMILVLAAYFLRNCPNNIRDLATMSRQSKLHRRKSDLNLLIDNSSGDEHP